MDAVVTDSHIRFFEQNGIGVVNGHLDTTFGPDNVRNDERGEELMEFRIRAYKVHAIEKQLFQLCYSSVIGVVSAWTAIVGASGVLGTFFPVAGRALLRRQSSDVRTGSESSSSIQSGTDQEERNSSRPIGPRPTPLWSLETQL